MASSPYDSSLDPRHISRSVGNPSNDGRSLTLAILADKSSEELFASGDTSDSGGVGGSLASLADVGSIYLFNCHQVQQDRESHFMMMREQVS